MRQAKTGGFTLIELLIVIAIIGILAAVLIPNLLSARQRAFDTAAQTCLKEIATHEEMAASVNPWEYTGARFTKGAAGVTFTWQEGDPPVDRTANIQSCEGVEIEAGALPAGTTNITAYSYNASHQNGRNTYNVQIGRGVTFLNDGTL